MGNELAFAQQAVANKTEGVKFDFDKVRFDLMPVDALQVVAMVLTFGAAKYDDRNWEIGMDHMRLKAAASRHWAAWEMGEDIDPETGLPHLAQAACCNLMLLSLVLRGLGTDNRPKISEDTRAALAGYQKEMQRAITTYRRDKKPTADEMIKGTEIDRTITGEFRNSYIYDSAYGG